MLDDSSERRLRVWGRSMLPAIWPGATIGYEPIALSELRVGDVIVVRDQAGLRVHRVHSLNRETVVTRGDHHDHEDTAVDASQILGRVKQLVIGRFYLPLPPAVGHRLARRLGRVSTSIGPRLVKLRALGIGALQPRHLRALRRRVQVWRVRPDIPDEKRIQRALFRRSAAWPPEFPATLLAAGRDRRLWLAEDRRGEPVGWLHLQLGDQKPPSIAELSIWVDPLHRGLGIATHFLSLARERAVELSVQRLVLEVPWPRGCWMLSHGFRLLEPGSFVDPSGRAPTHRTLVQELASRPEPQSVDRGFAGQQSSSLRQLKRKARTRLGHRLQAVLGTRTLRRLRSRMVKPRIGALESGDWPAVRRCLGGRRLDNHSTHLAWKERLAGTSAFVIGATAGGRMVGLLTVIPSRTDTSMAVEWDHWVHPLLRGLGIGAQLQKACIVEARRRGWRVLRAHARPESHSARLRIRLGYRPSPDLEPITPDHVVYSLTL